MGKLKLALVLALILLIPCVSLAAPQLINYQGQLNDSSGNPYNGDVSITFTIYNAPSAGDVLWTETQTVTVAGGVFNVLLGSQTPLLADTFYGDERYLGIKVDTDPEMTPRQRLASVPYALNCNGIDPTKPTVPTNVSITASWQGPNHEPFVFLTWDPSTDDAGVVEYRIHRNDIIIETIPATSNMYRNLHCEPLIDLPMCFLQELTTYCFAVSAFNVAGNDSGKSEEVCILSGGFMDNGDGTVTMQGEDLMWQQTDDGNTYNWYQANGVYNATYNPDTVDVCGNLTLGGYDDWRMPEPYDLYSRLKDTNYSPNCRPEFSCQPDYYWTYADYGTTGGAVNFSGGIYSDALSKSDTYYVRCVRDIIE